MEEKTAQQALLDLALDSAKENKQHSKRWFIGFLVTNALWGVVFIVAISLFFYRESQFEYAEETTETTVYQDTGEGSGNNVYQAGEYATYNEGGELNGEAGDQDQNDEANTDEN